MRIQAEEWIEYIALLSRSNVNDDDLWYKFLSKAKIRQQKKKKETTNSDRNVLSVNMFRRKILRPFLSFTIYRNLFICWISCTRFTSFQCREQTKVSTNVIRYTISRCLAFICGSKNQDEINIERIRAIFCFVLLVNRSVEFAA